MVARIWPVDNVNGAPSYTGRALRQLDGALVTGSTATRPLGARTGLTPGIPSNTVTASSTAWTCRPISGVADAEPSSIAGPYRFAFDTNTTGSITAADSTNPRIDTIYVQFSDPAEGDGTTTPGVKIDILTGTPASTPTAASLPDRSFALANISVPAAGGGNPSVSWIAPYTASAGGIIPTSGTNQYPASPYIGMCVDDTSDGLIRRWNGTKWCVVGGIDTGWTTVGVNTNQVALSQTDIVYRSNMFCAVRGLMSPKSGTSWTAGQNILGVLLFPAGFRPSVQKLSNPAGNNANIQARLTLNPNGSVDILIGSNPPGAVDLSALSGYIAEA